MQRPCGKEGLGFSREKQQRAGERGEMGQGGQGEDHTGLVAEGRSLHWSLGSRRSH